MREVIYYPTFEVQNETWLKFALLYFDKLNPIIPIAGNKYLSGGHWHLAQTSGLISPHVPTESEGETATIEAMYQVERVLESPDRFKAIFGVPDVSQVWKARKNQKAVLFRDKYTRDWYKFCTDNDLGEETDRGLMIAESLASVYMTLLAQVVGDERGLPSVTDRRDLDRFAIFTGKTDRKKATAVPAAQAVLELHLPANLRDIPLQKIVDHRTRPGFQKRQKAFHDELDRYLTSAEHGAQPKAFAGTLGSSWSDFRDDILKVGTGVTAFGVGVWLLLDSWNQEYLKALKEGAGGLALVVGSWIPVRNTWNTTSQRRRTRKYISDLNQLKPDSLRSRGHG